MVPEGWAESRLEQLTSQSITYGVVKPGDERAGGVPFVRGGDFPDGKIKIETLRTISPQVSSGYKRTILKGGEILVSLVGYPGATTVVPPELSGANIARQAALVRTNDKVDRDYLFHFLRSPTGQKRVLSQSIGSAQQVINLKDLKTVEVALPPLPEQRKIAEILSTWDRAIETAEALLATARTQKRALMQTLLTGKRRFPEFEGQDWKEVKIAQIAREVSVRNKIDAALPVISCSKFVGFVNSLDYFNKQVFSNDLTGYKIIRRNQIGYPSNHIEEGSIGIQNLYDAALVSPIYTVFETTERVAPQFLFRVLKTDLYRQRFAAATNASVDRRGSLRWKAFALIKVPLPSLKEQAQINTTMDAADAEIQKNEGHLEKLRAEKKALMQQLLTGKRRVKTKEFS